MGVSASLFLSGHDIQVTESNFDLSLGKSAENAFIPCLIMEDKSQMSETPQRNLRQRSSSTTANSPSTSSGVGSTASASVPPDSNDAGDSGTHSITIGSSDASNGSKCLSFSLGPSLISICLCLKCCECFYICHAWYIYIYISCKKLHCEYSLN